MTIPVLTVEQKLAVREAQFEVVGIHDQIRQVQAKAQADIQKLSEQADVKSKVVRTLVEGYATTAGCALNSVSFNMKDLAFAEIVPSAPSASKKNKAAK